MLRFSLLYFAVMCYAILLKSDASPPESNSRKGTKEDSRLLYPYCMMDLKKNTLWCDQSNYTRMPGLNRIHAEAMEIRATTTLFINESCIRSFHKGDLAQFPVLEVMEASQNQIIRLFSGAFVENKMMKTLILRFNAISTIDPDAFKGLGKLTYLNLDGNRLTDVSSGLYSSLPSLEELSFNYNKITILHKSGISRLRSLKTLRLKGNIISYIEDATFKGMDSLTELHLDGNRLSHITTKTFEGLDNLQLLSVSHNRIETWPSNYGKMFINLHTLHLGSNHLEHFTQGHVVNMSKLQNLSLDNNSLSEISEDLLDPLKRLTYLDMSRNYLDEIPKLAFKASCYLSVLMINHNKIKTPHSEWFQHFAANHDDSEQRVNLTGNPWQCDCSVIKYQSFLDNLRLDRDTTSLMEMLEIICSSPKYAASRILDDDLMVEIQYRAKCPPPTTEPTPTTPCVDSKCNYTTPFTPVLFVPSEINHPDTGQLAMPNFGLSAMTSTVSLQEEVTESGGSPGTPFFVSIPIVTALCVVFFVYYYKSKKRKNGGKSPEHDKKTSRTRTLSQRRLLSSEGSAADLEINPTITTPTLTLETVLEDNVFDEEPEMSELMAFNTGDMNSNYKAVEANLLSSRLGNRAEGDGKSVGGTPNMRRDNLQATNVV